MNRKVAAMGGVGSVLGGLDVVLFVVGCGVCLVTGLEHRLAEDLRLPRSVGDLRPCGDVNMLAGTGLVPVSKLILQKLLHVLGLGSILN